ECVAGRPRRARRGGGVVCVQDVCTSESDAASSGHGSSGSEPSSGTTGKPSTATTGSSPDSDTPSTSATSSTWHYYSTDVHTWVKCDPGYAAEAHLMGWPVRLMDGLGRTSAAVMGDWWASKWKG